MANNTDGTVSVITTATHSVSAPITVGSQPVGVTITADGEHAYVANNTDGTVSVITTATGAVSPPIAVGSRPRGTVLCPEPAEHPPDSQPLPPLETQATGPRQAEFHRHHGGRTVPPKSLATRYAGHLKAPDCPIRRTRATPIEYLFVVKSFWVSSWWVAGTGP